MTRVRGISTRLTNSQNLSEEIAKALSVYTNEVEESLEKAKIKVARDAAKTLKKSSPEKTGNYASGWAVKQVGTARVVHNKTDWQLTHLLENGHAKKGGGRVAAKVHIKPVEEKAINDFEKSFKEAIE